jgi:hypothetical protein
VESSLADTETWQYAGATSEGQSSEEVIVNGIHIQLHLHHHFGQLQYHFYSIGLLNTVIVLRHELQIV